MNIKKIQARLPIVMDSVTQANVAGSAAEMSYYLLLALFPTLLMVANVIPLLPLDQDMVVSLFQEFLPEQISALLVPTLESYLSNSHPEIVSVGFILSIWSASVAFNTLQNVLNRVYAVNNTANFFITRALSFLLALALVVAVGLMSIVFVFGQTILESLSPMFPISEEILSIFSSLRWPVLLVVLLLMFIYIYQFIPQHHYKFVHNLPGAIVASLLMLLLSSFFSLYVQYFGGTSVSNGTIGVFIVLMLFLYFSAMVIVIGALLNQIIYQLTHMEEFMVEPKPAHYYQSDNYQTLYEHEIYRGNLPRSNSFKEE